MKLDALDHPKTFDFASRLGLELPAAIGHLELLWAFTGKQAAQGNIGKWPDGAIARACYWMGEPAAFIRALRESGFLDADSTHRLAVHDWEHHAPGWVRAKLKKLSIQFISADGLSNEPTSEPSLEPTSDGSSKPSSRARVCSVVKGSEGKGSVCVAPAAPDAPTTPVWDAYAATYRERYGEPPVRNAKVNAQLKQFIGRIGAAEAPLVAQFYVAHPSAFYVQRGHSIACLLADAEKLRTEWATNRTITGTQARQQERTASNGFAQLVNETQRQEALTNVK